MKNLTKPNHKNATGRNRHGYTKCNIIYSIQGNILIKNVM